MNRFKILILSGVITALCSHFAWAGTINSISVDQENRTVVVSVQLCESNIDEFQSKTTFQNGIFEVEIYAIKDTSTPCESEFQVSFNVPECREYSQISVLLFAPDGHDAMPAEAAMGIAATCDVGGVNSCNDAYNACLATCAACESNCMMDPLTMFTCLPLCKMDYTCLDDLNACQLLWDQSVIEEMPAMTVQPVFKEVVDNTQNIVVDCMPNKLNLKSKRKWVTCYLGVPPEGSLEDINIDSITLTYMGNSELTVKKSDIEDEMLMVKFSRQELIEGIGSADVPGNIELTVTGILADGTFSGTDTIQVVNRGKKKKTQKAKSVKKAKKVQLVKKK